MTKTRHAALLSTRPSQRIWTRLRGLGHAHSCAICRSTPGWMLVKASPNSARGSANRGAFDGKGVNFILRKDPTQKLRSNWNDDGTRDTTAPGREVSQLSDTGNALALRGKLASALDGHTRMLTHDHRLRRAITDWPDATSRLLRRGEIHSRRALWPDRSFPVDGLSACRVCSSREGLRRRRLAAHFKHISDSELTDQEALGYRAASPAHRCFNPVRYVPEPGVLLSDPAISLQRFRIAAERSKVCPNR